MDLRERQNRDVLISKRLNEIEEEVYALLVPKHKESSIRMDNFSDLYGAEVIKRDKERVAQLRKIFADLGRADSPEKKDNKKRAQIFEALLTQMIELENWLGQEAETIVPSEFDDFENGVDLMVEFQSKGGFKHLALSIDATTHIPSIEEKLERIKGDIEHGHLTTIKYFISEKANLRGELKEVPRVVIGAEAGTIKELSGLWLKTLKAKQKKQELEKSLGQAANNDSEFIKLKKEIRTLQTQMAEHRIQFQILEEIKMQLECFIKLAKTNKNPDLEHKLQGALDTILQISNEKETELSEEERVKIDNDAVYRAIQEGIGL